MNKKHFWLCCVAIAGLIIGTIALACFSGGLLFYVFYNLGFGLLLCTLVPLRHSVKNKESLASMGLRRPGARGYIVMAAFIVFSIGGQSIPLIIEKTPIQWNLLALGLAPLIMTTFFEEFLFRGFMQTRLERLWGWLPAALFSGLMFSVYHLGYPGFRNLGDLLLLFAVGTGFALAFTLSGNNLYVSYFVNLPNALLTYALKSQQFPVFNTLSVVFAAITVVLIIVTFLFAVKKYPFLRGGNGA